MLRQYKEAVNDTTDINKSSLFCALMRSLFSVSSFHRSTLIQDIHQGRTGCEKTHYSKSNSHLKLDRAALKKFALTCRNKIKNSKFKAQKMQSCHQMAWRPLWSLIIWMVLAKSSPPFFNNIFAFSGEKCVWYSRQANAFSPLISFNLLKCSIFSFSLSLIEVI